ncbi:hypothetical protein [Burkholderia guangdongensis]|uniref:hypothetical protein n=1 Tax=Burkholderia guangdongensis TaxID=1792500 RepID=UPI0015CAA32B|nr:hypothetical protein [Burkholderia guangdongensis]
MRRIDSRAVCAALFLCLALAACDGGGSAGPSSAPSSSAPSANSQQAANAEDNPPGPPVMHWAPDSGASNAH